MNVEMVITSQKKLTLNIKKIVNVFEAMKSLCFSIKNNQARAVLPRLQPRTVCSGWLRNAGALPTKILQADL